MPAKKVRKTLDKKTQKKIRGGSNVKDGTSGTLMVGELHVPPSAARGVARMGDGPV